MLFPKLRHCLLGGLFSLALTASCLAQPAAPTILPISHPTNTLVFVTPDRTDWTYPLGATGSFRIKVDLKPFPTGGVPVKYRLGSEMREGAETNVFVPAEGLVLPVTSPAEPGFIRCIVTTTIDGKNLRELATMGFAPEKITPTQTEPADFDKFWAEQKAALEKIPADFQLTPAPELSTTNVEVSYLSFQNVGGWYGRAAFTACFACRAALVRFLPCSMFPVRAFEVTPVCAVSLKKA